MRKASIVIVFLAICPLLLAQQPLNNDSVIKMVKMGFPEEMIVTAINRSPGAYDTSADGLITLKNAGVGSKAISAMVSKTSVAVPTPPAQTVPVPEATHPGMQASGQQTSVTSGKKAESSQQMNGTPLSATITNADVINMTKAGIGEQTILIAIQHGRTKFDTSPQALIVLKAGGVSDQVLNAVLGAVDNKDQTETEPQSVDAAALFQKALDAIGPHEKLATIHSLRWKGVLLQNTQDGTKSFERELIRVYPDRSYMSVQASTGLLQKQVVTPDFNYRRSGTMTTAVPSADLNALREQADFDTVNVAQHADAFTITSAGHEQAGTANAEKLKISKSGRDVIWLIDPQTGRLLSSRQPEPSGDLITEFSDWRVIDGVHVAFKRHITGPGASSDLTVTEYEFNPTIDEKLFQRPTTEMSQSLTLKVLQEQSVPYIQQSGGGISTSCSIEGTANTSAYANTVGNSAYGNATTTSNQHMNCNSYDTTVRWPHVLNVMFAEGSDGISYMFACDRAWRWSKCTPLRSGQVFNARFTNKGLEVEAFSTKGKEENPTYHVLQSKSSR